MALGIGLSTYVEITGGPVAGSEFGRVEVHPREDGDGVDVVVYTGSSPHGQGLATAFSMLASDQLGVPLERVRVLHGDTDHVARGGGTMGSRSLQLGGSACGPRLWRSWRRPGAGRPTCWRRRPRTWCSTLPGACSTVGTPTVARSWAEVAAAGDGLAADADFNAQQPTYPSGTHVAVVEVDTETGEARLLRLVACDDAGRVLNPLLAEGQRHGGLAQGAAQALFEEVAFDADGNPLTTNFADYAFPSAAELPSFELVDFATPPGSTHSGPRASASPAPSAQPPAQNAAVTLWPIWVCATWTCRARPSGSGAIQSSSA